MTLSVFPINLLVKSPTISNMLNMWVPSSSIIGIPLPTVFINSNVSWISCIDSPAACITAAIFALAESSVGELDTSKRRPLINFVLAVEYSCWSANVPSTELPTKSIGLSSSWLILSSKSTLISSGSNSGKVKLVPPSSIVTSSLVSAGVWLALTWAM